MLFGLSSNHTKGYRTNYKVYKIECLTVNLMTQPCGSLVPYTKHVEQNTLNVQLNTMTCNAANMLGNLTPYRSMSVNKGFYISKERT